MNISLHSRLIAMDGVYFDEKGNIHFAFRWMPALLGLKLGLTCRCDNNREHIKGWNPAAEIAGKSKRKDCSSVAGATVPIALQWRMHY